MVYQLKNILEMHYIDGNEEKGHVEGNVKAYLGHVTSRDETDRGLFLRIAKRYLPFVVLVSKKFWNPFVDIFDLIRAGNVGN